MTFYIFTSNFFCFFAIYDVLVVPPLFTFFLIANVFYLYFNKLFVFLLNLLPLRIKQFFSYFYFFSLNFLITFLTFCIIWSIFTKFYFSFFTSHSVIFFSLKDFAWYRVFLLLLDDLVFYFKFFFFFFDEFLLLFLYVDSFL